MTPQLLQGPPGLGRGVLFCLLVGVALAEVSMPWFALLRCPLEDNVRAISAASSSVTGLTASPVSLFTRARQYRLRSANCSEASESSVLVLGFSTLVASSRGAGGESGPSRLDMLTSEVILRVPSALRRERAPRGTACITGCCLSGLCSFPVPRRFLAIPIAIRIRTLPCTAFQYLLQVSHRKERRFLLRASSEIRVDVNKESAHSG